MGRDVDNFPVYLRSWRPDEIPGGIPAESGWHQMGLRVEGERLWAYWDDQELPGGPATDSRIPSGYFGIYANYVGTTQVARTPVDGIAVR